MATADTNDLYYVFFSHIPNSTVIYPDGTVAAFIGGRYTTKDKYKASILQDAIAAGHPHIYVDTAKLQLTEAELDPMAEYKARVIAEYEASKIAGDKNSDKGSSTQGRLNVADTNSVGEAAADSTSGAAASTPAVKISLGK